ncbi:MAG: radical SAM protein [Gammaproteobacteria bacterium]|nr:radical SAM protein [Gammaproteobacteria bacterium]
MNFPRYLKERFFRPRNARILSEAAARLPERVAAAPTYLQVEATNRCNLRCVMCPIEDLTRARRKKRLSVEEFAHILNEFPYIESLHLQGIGEPLTNPHIAELVACAKTRGIGTGVITNGTVLDREAGEALIRAGLSNAIVSLDSADADNYQAIRKGADFQEVTDNIRKFVLLRQDLDSPTPSIGIMMVAMNNNVHELREMVRLANDLGVDFLTVKGLNPAVAPGLELNPSQQQANETLGLLADPALRPGFQVQLAYLERSPVVRCRWPWTRAYVTAEGDVTPCCNCPDARQVSFGNLFDRPMREIWNNEAYRAFRRELRDGMPDVCRHCPDWHQPM